MSDLRDALGQIMTICAASRTYTRRTQHIHDVAMRALGMTAGQRAANHQRVAEQSTDITVTRRVEQWNRRQLKIAENAERAA